MSAVRTRLALGAVIALVAAGAVQWGPGLMNRDDKVAVTFTALVGDGRSWAGGFHVAYAVGANARAVEVTALAKDDIRPVTWSVTKLVDHGTAVSMAVTPAWPGKIVKLQLRGKGVDSRPVYGTSPAVVTITTTVK